MRAETLTLLHGMSVDADTLRAMGTKEGMAGLQLVGLAQERGFTPCFPQPASCQRHAPQACNGATTRVC